ncbi:MAG TPA: antibiotic biosynthesis monooxygenase [Telluria sp.]|nr:antibiotic biosynthesis monooxygenase [Telluria sp.]
MIEADLSYDLLPGIDLKAYGEWVKRTVSAMMQAPGMIEFRAGRNILGAPQVRAATVWRSLEDWSRFTEGRDWQSIQAELQGYAAHVKVELWGPSPVLPEPMRPLK